MSGHSNMLPQQHYQQLQQPQMGYGQMQQYQAQIPQSQMPQTQITQQVPYQAQHMQQPPAQVQYQMPGAAQNQQRLQLQQFWQQQQLEMESISEPDFKNHQLPLARIKKIMKSDEDVRMISAEAPVLFSKACEMFILELTLRSWIHTEENKRRTLQRNDIAAAITKTDIFDFLVDIVPRDEIKEAHEAMVAGSRPQAAMPGQEALQYPMYYIPQQQQQQQPPMQQGGGVMQGDHGQQMMVNRPPVHMDHSMMYQQQPQVRGMQYMPHQQMHQPGVWQQPPQAG